MSGWRKADKGSAAILVVAVIAVVMAMTLAALSLAEVRVSRHRAAATADLAAIAGAATWPPTPSGMCARAREVGRLNGALATDCHLDGRAVAVRVTVSSPGLLPRLASVSARARAIRDSVPMASMGTRTTRTDRSTARGHLPVMRMAAP